MHIFSYLDLKSLRLCMRVCKRYKAICSDPFFYRELNLKVSIAVFNLSLNTIILYENILNLIFTFCICLALLVFIFL